MIGLGVVLAKVLSPAIRKVLPQERYEECCMVLAGSCSLLMAWNISYMFGIVLTVIFVSCGNASSAKIYLEDQGFRKEERRLIRSRFYGMGAVLEQAVMLIFINAFSGYYLKTDRQRCFPTAFRLEMKGMKKYITRFCWRACC